MKISTNQIKKLRDETGAGVIDVKHALEETSGNLPKAKTLLAKQGKAKAQKRAERPVAAGFIASYVHATGTVAALVALASETDFVARTDEFKHLARELAMQVASMDPKDTSDLLKQDYIRDSSKKVKDLIEELIAKTGENIKIHQFSRLQI